MSISTGTLNKAFITAITALDTREINKHIIDVAMETGFDDLMRIIEGYKPTEQPNFHHFVNEDLFQVMTIDAGGVSGSGSTTLTVTITNTGYARRGLKVLFADGGVGYINSDITTASTKDSFTIKSVDGVNLTAVAGDKFISMGVVTGEGSGEVTSLKDTLTKYFNLVEHLRDKTVITDMQEMSKVEVGTGYEAYRQALNLAQRFKTEISTTLTAGKKSVNEYGTASPTTVDENGNSQQTTGGWVNEIVAYGANCDVSSPGTVTLTDQDTLADALLAVKAPSQFMVILGDAAKRKTDYLWKNISGTAITPVKINFDGKEFDVTVDQARWGKFTQEYVNLALLDHPQKFKFTGASLVGKRAYGIPKDRVKVAIGPNGKGGFERRIGVRYMKNPYASKNQGTEYVREWYTGANNDTPTDGTETKTCHVSTTQGVEVLGGRQTFFQRILS